VLADVLDRPAVIPVPPFALRAALGAMADELLLASARVIPRRLSDTGYEFCEPDLESALRHMLGRY
jgi:NAD dependent epimerase/dehydratase family enzyme